VVDLHAAFGIAAALVSLLGYPIYALEFLGPGTGLRATLFRALGLRGGTSPRLVSWVLWTAVQAVIFSGADALGATDTNWLPLAYLAGCAGVSALAIRHGDRSVSALDLACGALGSASLVLLFGARNPLAALCLAIAADSLASVPTLWSVWKDPRNESLAGWLCFLLGGLLNLGALPSLDPRAWTFETAGYTLIVLVQQAWVVGRIALARRPRPLWNRRRDVHET
jgi:hypothetical protein